MTESRDYFPLSVKILVGVKGLEPPASCSQSRRATNCATPGYFVILFGWSYSPKAGALPTALHPVIFDFFTLLFLRNTA